MLEPRIPVASGDLEVYWRHHFERDHRRIHPNFNTGEDGLTT